MHLTRTGFIYKCLKMLISAVISLRDACFVLFERGRQMWPDSIWEEMWTPCQTHQKWAICLAGKYELQRKIQTRMDGQIKGLMSSYLFPPWVLYYFTMTLLIYNWQYVSHSYRYYKESESGTKSSCVRKKMLSCYLNSNSTY